MATIFVLYGLLQSFAQLFIYGEYQTVRNLAVAHVAIIHGMQLQTQTRRDVRWEPGCSAYGGQWGERNTTVSVAHLPPSHHAWWSSIKQMKLTAMISFSLTQMHVHVFKIQDVIIFIVMIRSTPLTTTPTTLFLIRFTEPSQTHLCLYIAIIILATSLI